LRVCLNQSTPRNGRGKGKGADSLCCPLLQASRSPKGLTKGNRHRKGRNRRAALSAVWRRRKGTLLTRGSVALRLAMPSLRLRVRSALATATANHSSRSDREALLSDCRLARLEVRPSTASSTWPLTFRLTSYRPCCARLAFDGRTRARGSEEP
jgi:hypothetical protein